MHQSATEGSTGTYDQERSDEAAGDAVDQESREAIEKSFEVICKCFAPQDVDGDDALARAQTIESEAQARLDAFGSSRSCPHSFFDWDWAWMRLPEEDCQDVINEDDASRQTSKVKRLLQLLRASKVYKDEAFDNELEKIDEHVVDELETESDSFMQDVLERVAFRFRYKQKWHVGRAVHILVLQSDATVAEVLLRKLRSKVDISHRCRNRAASVLPVHLAAGGGHPDMLKTIIELRADINAKTTLRVRDGGTRDHYTALHEACFLQRSQAAELLIASRADIDCTNLFGDTPLHLAAKLAPPLAQVLADVLVKNRADVMALNDKKLRPIDDAIDRCNFPVRDMHLLTDYGLDDLARVAKQSALAAVEMMRDSSESDEWEFKVNRKSRQRLAEEAETRRDVCDIWCRLMEDAPQAAEAVIEALTLEPRPEAKFHHPLPKYAMLRSDEAFRSHYTEDRVWEYDAERKPMHPAWHLGASGLAPQKRTPPWIYKLISKDVGKTSIEIKVLMIPNMICPEVFLQLKRTTNLHIFTKIAVRAILDHAWHEGVADFYFAELGLKSLVIAILCWWVLRPPVGFWARATWSCLSVSACRELCYELLELRGYIIIAGGGRLSIRGVKWWLTLENVFDLSTSSLLFWLVMYLSGKVDAESLASMRELLTIVVLARWLQLAYAYRSFPAFGNRLIPILQTVTSMGGILPLTFIAFIGFWQAFCALGAADETSSKLFIDSIRFLFVGDGDGIDMVLGLGDGSVAEPSPWAALILISAMFFFCILLLNIFIATTDQAYEQSLEFVYVRFLQERASICFECFFRLCLPCRLQLSPCKLLSILLFLILPAWLGMLSNERIPVGATSSIMAVLSLLLDAAMVRPHWHGHGRRKPPEDRAEPLGSTETWTSQATAVSCADCVSDSKSSPDMPGMVEQHRHLPVVPSPSASVVPLPCWAQLPALPPLPPPQMDAGGEEQPGRTGSRRDSVHSVSGTSEERYLWICHREDCSEFDLWPSARSADGTSARLEGRVSNLKRDSMLRGRKTDRDILDLKRCMHCMEDRLGRIEAQLSRRERCMEYRLDRIEELLSRRDGEVSNSAAVPKQVALEPVIETRSNSAAAALEPVMLEFAGGAGR